MGSRIAEGEADESDAVAAELAVMLARLGALAGQPVPGPDAVRIDRIAVMERLRAALAAAAPPAPTARSPCARPPTP